MAPLHVATLTVEKSATYNIHSLALDGSKVVLSGSLKLTLPTVTDENKEMKDNKLNSLSDQKRRSLAELKVSSCPKGFTESSTVVSSSDTSSDPHMDVSKLRNGKLWKWWHTQSLDKVATPPNKKKKSNEGTAQPQDTSLPNVRKSSLSPSELGVMSADKLSGSNTLQYQAIRKNYHHMVMNFEQVLTKLTALCFEKELISTTERDDPRRPLYDQSEALLRRILKKVELNHKWYDVLLTVLDEFPELSDIKLSVEISYASEEGSQLQRSRPRLEERHSESLPRRSPRLEEISRRHSETHSKNVHPTNLRSKYKQLEEKVGKLRQTGKEQSKKIEDLGGEVYERDTVIENLKKELNGKDDIDKKYAQIELQNVIIEFKQQAQCSREESEHTKGVKD